TLNDGGNNSGAQTSTLTLSNVLAADVGGYSVIVSNAYGSVTSAVAALAVNQAVYSVLHDFSGSDGANPYANLTLSGSTLYGTTAYGGSSGNGTVFAVNTDGTDFTTLHSFTGGSNGADPYANLTLSGSTLYGTTAYGGSSGNGTVFAVNTDGTSFTTLYSFTAVDPTYGTNSDGAYPSSGLILSDNTLYGTAKLGGGFGNGTVFAVNTDGTGFTNLYSFTAEAWVSSINASTNSDGANPVGGLILSGNTLYGTASAAGSCGKGTVFAVNTDGTDFTTLHSFTGGSDGANPVAGLILSGNTLYGTASGGGSSGPGTVFAINTDGSGFTTLHSFTGGSDGANPYANLTLSGSTLYGTTWGGGSSASGTVFYWGYGTVFAVNTDGTCFTTLHSFRALSGSGPYFGTNSDGAVPQAGLILSGNTLYGTTVWGGSSGGGTVFSLSLLPPTIITPPQSQSAEAGASVDFAVDAISSQPLTYQWLLNGTNAVSDATTNSDLILTNVQFSQSGAYTVVITNLFGAVTSAPVMVNVIPAVERRPAPAINLTGEVGSLLNVEYIDVLGPPANWLLLDTVTLTNTSQFCFDPSV